MEQTQPKSGFVQANGIRLHYLDWGGEGPALVFVPGMGLSAYIFGRLAPRFTPWFRVLALTRRGHGDSDYPESGYDVDTLTEDLRQFLDAQGIEQAALAGHSMANVELTHFAALYPERVLKLVYIDAAFDRTTPEFKRLIESNPLRNIQFDESQPDCETLEEYAAWMLRTYPALAPIFGDLFMEELPHGLARTPEGKLKDKMSDEIGAALMRTLQGYASEDAAVLAPVLSIYAENTAETFRGHPALTPEQAAQVDEYFERQYPALWQACIEQYRERVPQAQIVTIPRSHHYCFITDEDMVFEAMRDFLAG